VKESEKAKKREDWMDIVDERVQISVPASRVEVMW
jgi:hypothetical protein